MNAPLIFLDTETTSLEHDADIWEFAAIRREPDGAETELHLFIEHDEQKCRQLPEAFLTDHLARFPGHGQETSRREASHKILAFTGQRGNNERPHIVGAVPNFDTERIEVLIRTEGIVRKPEWHYHLIDVENLAIGYLWRKVAENREAGYTDSILPSLPWKSDEISTSCGVEPPGDDERHTALGDARWAMRLYDAITGGAA